MRSARYINGFFTASRVVSSCDELPEALYVDGSIELGFERVECHVAPRF